VNTGAKIAIGCGVAALLAGGAVVVGVVGLGFWAKGKVEQIAGDQQRIDDLQKKADANPFTRPADGVLREDRLLKFLEVRKGVFAVYEKHQAELEAISKKKQGDLGDLQKGFALINDLRLAQAQALAAQGMGQEEYRFHVEQVYKTMLAAEVAKQSGGKSVSEATRDQYEAAAEQARKAAEEAEKGTAGTDANLTPEQREAARKAAEQMKQGASDLEKQAGELADKAKDLDAPPQNIALFRKHETEIRKYAMSGLELLGL
jgi:hypothetical protein